MTMPWEKDTNTLREKQYYKRFLQNRSMQLVKVPASNSEKKMFYSQELARSQAVQTKDLMDIIRQHGVNEHGSMPQVYCLRKGPALRWIMSDEGNHRAHIAHILGYDSLA